MNKFQQAKDLNTDPAKLAELRKIPKGTFKASDKNVDVRRFVACNPSTPSEALIKLASDKDFYVRSSIAANPSTTREILEILLLDPWIHDEVIKILVEKQSEQNKTF
jgi:hypothetical protein